MIEDGQFINRITVGVALLAGGFAPVHVAHALNWIVVGRV